MKPSSISTDPAPEYGANSYRFLEGLEAVKTRPGMYTHTESPDHILQEVIDNAFDEALAGHCSVVEVALYQDGSASVSDNGRGIPVEVHAEKNKSLAELTFTVLHKGAKFDKDKKDNPYRFAGGLHGVGVSVTNALSSKLECRITKNGQQWELGFDDGDITTPLKLVGPKTGHGTFIRFWPNPIYFDTNSFSNSAILKLLKFKSVSIPKLKVIFKQETDNGWTRQELVYDNGLVQYLEELTPNAVPLGEIFYAEYFADANSQNYAEGEGAAWALGWYPDESGTGDSCVNLVPTSDGGTHDNGLKHGVTEAIRAYAETHALLPKAVRITAEDVWKNVRYVLATKMLDPKFGSQAKDKLTSREAYDLISTAVFTRLEPWLIKHQETAKLICEAIISNAQSRMKQATAITRKRSSSVVLLPGKLTDCESTDPTRTELFLVEGDSAGGSAKQGRDRAFQAILPLRGKIKNTWEVKKDSLFENKEILDICTALGVDPHEKGQGNLSKLRYHRLNIMTDADVDGMHIRVLLIAAFYKHLPDLVLKGHVHIALPPLYRLDVSSAGKNKPAKKVYIMDEPELTANEDRLTREGYKNWKISRFKGLGEMMAIELWETTLCPDTRKLVRVREVDGISAESLMNHLMNTADSGWRRAWMTQRGHEISAFDL